jgi:ketosteroid isomerase-like protein
MSNVERVREMLRVWNEEGLGGLVSRYDDFFTEDFEWRPAVTEVTGARYVGRAGFDRYVADVQELLGDVRARLQEATEIAPDVVRGTISVHAQGASSGVVIDAPAIAITRMRDGRQCWTWATYDPAAAERVAAAILSGEEVEV